MALTKVKAGNIILTTPGVSSNDVTPATTQYVTTAIGNLIDTAPSTLNTLNELAAALGDDVNFSTTVTNSIATKLPLAGGTMTGALTVNHNIKFGNSTNRTLLTSNAVYSYIGQTNAGTENPETNSAYFFGINPRMGTDRTLVVEARTADGAGAIVFKAGSGSYSTGAPERMRIDSSGQTTITTTAAIPLKVAYDSTNYMAIGHEFTNVVSGGVGHIFKVNNSQKMVLTAGGKLGIGISSSLDSSLNLNNNQAFARVLAADNSGTLRVGTRHTANNNNSLVIMGATHNTYYPASFVVDSSYASNRTTYDLTAYGVAYSGWNGAMSFKISNGASTVTEMLSLTTAGAVFPTGNVGIGTADPNEPLHISGSGYQRLKIQATGAGSGADLQLKSKNDSTQWILFNDSDSGNNSGVIKYVHSTNKMHFRTNDVDDRLVISSNGNVGIGTSAPTAQLSIETATGTNNTSYNIIDATTDNPNYKAQINLVREGSSGLLGWAFSTSNVTSPIERLRIQPNGWINAKAGPLSSYAVTPSGTNTILLLWTHESWSSSFSGSIQLNNWDGKSSHDIFFGPDYNTNASPSIYCLRHYGSTLTLLRVTYSGTTYLALKNNGATNRTWFFNGINSGEVPLMALVPESSVTINNTFGTY